MSFKLPTFHAIFVACAVCLAATVTVGCSGVGKANRKSSDTRYDLAVDYLHNHEYDAAELEAQKAIKYDPGNHSVHNVLGLIDFLRAVKNLSSLELDDCLTGVDAEGLRLEIDELLLRADKHFARAASIDKEYGEAMANRGVVAMNRDNFRSAVKHFKQALQYPSRLDNVSLTRAHLGWAHFRTGEHVLAAKELRQALQFKPGMCVATFRLGVVYFERGELEKAGERFDQVTNDTSCRMPEALLYAGQTYAKLGLASKTEQAVAQCVQLAPQSCTAAKCRAITLQKHQPSAAPSSTNS